MSITVRGPDGAVITFPDGTPHSVIEREMARHYGHAPEQERDRRSAAVSLSNPKDKRSLGERLGAVFSHTWNTGFIAEGWRAGGAIGFEIQGIDYHAINAVQWRKREAPP